MKKTLSVLLAAVLFLSVFSCSAMASDTKSYDFVPTLTNNMDKTASDWYSSSLNRAMLTVFLILDATTSSDVPISSDYFGASLVSSTYVGRSGSTVGVCCYYGDHEIIHFIYSPTLHIAKVSLFDVGEGLGAVRSAIIKETMQATYSDGYEENSSSMINLVIQLVGEAMNK